AAAANHAGIGQRVAAVEGERGVVDDVAGDAAGGARIAELQRPGADRRPPGVGAVPSQRQRAGATLGERAGAADHAGIGQRVAAVEGERGVVDDVAGDAARGAAAADLQRAGADRRPTGVGVGTGENERTRTRLGECAGAADYAGIGQRIAAI